ncbi:copper homeostasis protein cutC homolog isoform X1 [Mobula hypostoma]|uniref:copper homeostasis protein cutC homolog isoform X1 n=1 Tax=Mobula hypostoma TaxID=723540 RepID=UPI002FC3779C
MSDTPAKKQKLSTEWRSSRDFQQWWSERFGMIKKGDKALCVLCSETVVCRTSSVKRHYKTVHKWLCDKSEEEQKEHISRAISNKKLQSNTMPTFVSGSSNLVAASFEVSKVIAQHGRPLSDGEYVKESWLECAPFLFDGFQEKEKIIQRIKDLPVSRNTVKDRILMMGTNITEQLTKDLSSCKFLSICLDESSHVTPSARLVIIARFCRGDEICEELVNFVTLSEHPTGAEICKAVIKELSGRQVNLSKIVSVTTDGAPSMCGKEADFANLFEKYVGHPTILNGKCRSFEETANFVKCADSITLDKLNLEMLQWIDLDNFEMQLIDLQSSSIWRQKFVDLRAELENIERDRLVTGSKHKNTDNEFLKLWNSIPETFNCLKDLAVAILTVFSSTYSCESLFSLMNLVKSNLRSRLTDETSATCIALKTTRYKPDINYLSSLVQQQKSH